MLRRLHSKMVGAGSICGLPPSPPAEVFLKTLPPPEEANPLKYERFKKEEEKRSGARGEPFYEFVTGAAGHKHCVLLTTEGNMVTFGDSRFGQTAAVKSRQPEMGGGEHGSDTDWSPLYIDLAGFFPEEATPSTRVSCGTNFSIVYQQGTRRVLCFGNNHVGQLGVGDKKAIDARVGFQRWDTCAGWWPSSEETTVKEIVCGYNHSVLTLTDGSLYAFGSNTWGELGIGTTVSPVFPTRIETFDGTPHRIRKAAAGNSFSLFLTEEGRVYGCGATNHGQIPSNSFEPVPIPLTRSFQQDYTGVPKLDKLIRIKDIACVGSMSVYVSEKDEIFLQGAFPEFGVLIPSPRFTVLDQTSAKQKFIDLSGGSLTMGDFKIEKVFSGPANLFVQYTNGCIAGMGANSEGQIQGVWKTFQNKTINMAPTFLTTELFPIWMPASSSSAAATGDRKTWFTSGKGFTLLVDNAERYVHRETTKPIELPPATALEEKRRRQRLVQALSNR